MRKTLANQEDNSVTIVATGTQSCLARLLKSNSDDISDLSGAELISKKVERTVVMGGRFKDTWPMPVVEHGVGELVAEYNIIGKVNVSDEGITTWEKSDNFRQSYLLPRKDYSFVENDIEEIIESELPNFK